MRPYSADLRQRVFAAIVQREGSEAEIARIFRVSLSFVSHLVQRYRRTGNIQPKPHGGGRRPALDETSRQRLLQLIQEQPDVTLKELRQRLGVTCSLTTIWRTLRDLKITRKKKVLQATERDSPRVQKQRRAFDQEMAQIDPQHLVFVDECGAHTAMTRTYGRAPRGQRVVGTVPGQWQTVTLISGMRLSEVVAPWVFVGATDTVAFQTYVTEVLVPELRSGDVVIWDNLRPHKDASVVEAVQRAGATVQSLPPYSPDKTPIEKLCSKAKKILRDLGARTIPTVMEAVGTALKAVQSEDIAGWFRSCGIVLSQT